MLLDGGALRNRTFYIHCPRRANDTVHGALRVDDGLRLARVAHGCLVMGKVLREAILLLS